MKLINAEGLIPNTSEYVPTGKWVSWEEIEQMPEANVSVEILNLRQSRNYWRERALSFERTIVKLMKVINGEEEDG